MHYVRAGRGAPSLVFVHGFACSHEDWQPQLDFFSRTNDVVACDLRGHGATPGRRADCSIETFGADVAALLSDLQLSGAVLIGHSMGCRVVLEANRRAPQRVAGIVLIDGSRNAAQNPQEAEHAARATVEKMGYTAFAETLFRQMFFMPSAQADAIIARAVKESREFGPELWPRVTRWDAGEMDAAFDAVSAPVLAIQSTTRNAQLQRAPLKRGDTSPWLDYLRSRGAAVEIIPGVGHFTQLEASDAVNRLIASFAAARR